MQKYQYLLHLRNETILGYYQYRKLNSHAMVQLKHVYLHVAAFMLAIVDFDLR